MADIRVMPFVEQLVIDYLLTVDDVTTVIGQNVGTKLPGDKALPYVLVQRVGGSEAVREHLDAPRVQVAAYAASQATAWQVAALVRGALLVADRAEHALGVVTGVVGVLGPIWLPDPPTNRPRYVLDVLVYVHPHPVAAGS